MPSKFTGELQAAQPVDRRLQESDLQTNDTIATVARVAKAAGSVAFEKIDTGILQNVISESTGVLSEVANYEKRKRELLLASSVADKAALDKYSEELRTLRSGEQQGRISPAMATAKLSILSKETQKRYPHLESQIRAVTDQSISGVRAISAESDKLDPDLKAAYDVVEKAAAAGKTPRQYLEDMAADDALAQSDKRLKVAQNLGQGLETAMRAHVSNFTTVAINGVLGSLLDTAKKGTLVKEDELAQLAALQGNLTTQVQQQITQQELETGARFGQGFRDSVVKEVSDRIATITTMANNMDTIDKQKKFLSWALEKAEKEGKLQVIHDLGTLGVLAVTGANGPEVYTNALGFMAQINKGMRPTLEARAANGDSETAFLLHALDSGMFPKWAMPNVDAAGNGRPTESSGNPIMDKAGQGFVLSAIGDPKIKLETRQNYVIALVGSRGMFSDGLETALEHRGSLPFIQTDPKVKQAVVDTVVQRQRSAMHDLQPAVAGQIVYNSVKKQFEVDPAVLAEQKSQFEANTRIRAGQNPRLTPYGFNSDPASTVPASVMRTIDAANLGLRAYTIMGGDIPAYVKDVFEQINKSVNPTGEAPTDAAPKPKVELTPEQMDQADKDFNSVLADLKARKLTGAMATLKMKEIAMKYHLD